MVLYKPRPADVVQCCAVITEVREGNDEQSKPSRASSKKAGKSRRRSHSQSQKSSQKASSSGKLAWKAPGNVDSTAGNEGALNQEVSKIWILGCHQCYETVKN
jgi:hypothetical protein